MTMPFAVTLSDIVIHVPDSTNWEVELGGLLGTAVTTLAIVVAALLAVRLTHVVVGGGVRALLTRERDESPGTELTAAEITKRQQTIEGLVVNFVRFFVWVVAGLMILETVFRLDIGPAIAGLGIAGIAVGLGTQHLVRDYLNGALILIENQYARGDVVSVAGISGMVEDFTLRRTTLRDLDGTLHTIPNGEITVASNKTRSWARVNETVQVVYGSDMALVTSVIDEVGRELAEDDDWRGKVIEAPHVERISALGDRGVSVLVLGRVLAAAQWAVSGEFRRRLLGAFEANGIEMPTGVLLSWVDGSSRPSTARD
jgi:small-conductance mechanosensitive channel